MSRADVADCRLTTELGPAVALNAATPEEREALEAHVEQCVACARELESWRVLAAELGRAAPQLEPPTELLQRLLQRAAEEAQPLSTWGSTPAGPGQRRARRGWWLVASAGSLAAAVAAILWGFSLRAELESTQRQLADTSVQLDRIRGGYFAVASVLASTNIKVTELSATEAAAGARAKVWVDQNSGRGMMMARDLPPLSAGQTYQVWLVNPQGRVSGGFLRPNDEGVYYVVLQAPARLTEYQQLGVTVEPIGGSPGPTGPRMVGGAI